MPASGWPTRWSWTSASMFRGHSRELAAPAAAALPRDLVCRGGLARLAGVGVRVVTEVRGAWLTSAFRSDAGRMRTNNEDLTVCDADAGVFGVIDGVGGQTA